MLHHPLLVLPSRNEFRHRLPALGLVWFRQILAIFGHRCHAAHSSNMSQTSCCLSIYVQNASHGQGTVHPACLDLVLLKSATASSVAFKSHKLTAKTTNGSFVPSVSPLCLRSNHGRWKGRTPLNALVWQGSVLQSHHGLIRPNQLRLFWAVGSVFHSTGTRKTKRLQSLIKDLSNCGSRSMDYI